MTVGLPEASGYAQHVAMLLSKQGGEGSMIGQQLWQIARSVSHSDQRKIAAMQNCLKSWQFESRLISQSPKEYNQLNESIQRLSALLK